MWEIEESPKRPLPALVPWEIVKVGFKASPRFALSSVPG